MIQLLYIKIIKNLIMITIMFCMSIVLGVMTIAAPINLAIEISTSAVEGEKTIWNYLKYLFSFSAFWDAVKEEMRYGDHQPLLVLSLLSLWCYPLTIVMIILFNIFITIIACVMIPVSYVLDKIRN